jgi:hypothetical protein
VQFYDHTVRRLVGELVAANIGKADRINTEVPDYCTDVADAFKAWPRVTELAEAMALAP